MQQKFLIFFTLYHCPLIDNAKSDIIFERLWYSLNRCGIYIPIELNDHYSIVSDNLYSRNFRKEREELSIDIFNNSSAKLDPIQTSDF